MVFNDLGLTIGKIVGQCSLLRRVDSKAIIILDRNPSPDIRAIYNQPISPSLNTTTQKIHSQYEVNGGIH